MERTARLSGRLSTRTEAAVVWYLPFGLFVALIVGITAWIWVSDAANRREDAEYMKRFDAENITKKRKI